MLVRVKQFQQMAYANDPPAAATIRKKIQQGSIPGFREDGQYWIDWNAWCAKVREKCAANDSAKPMSGAAAKIAAEAKELAGKLTPKELAEFGLTT